MKSHAVIQRQTLYAMGALLFSGMASLLHAQAPVGPQWNSSEILNWDAATDPSGPYSRSAVPLATRCTVPTTTASASLSTLLNVNSHAHPGEGRTQPSIAWNIIPIAAAQGWRTTRYYAPTSWQYFDNLVFWAGSSNDTRPIMTPLAHIIDASHRNGVPIYGKVFWGWSGSTTDYQDIQNFLKKTNGTFPVADKMIAIANYYGFDGWFIDNENFNNTAADAANFRDFILYYRSKASNQQIIWYDSIVETGGLDFQNQLDDKNSWSMMYNGNPVAHGMLTNYSWYSYPANLSNSRSVAQSLGISPYIIYAGIWLESHRTLGNVPDPNGNNNIAIRWDYLFPENQPHNVSVGLFGAEYPFLYNNPTSPNAVISNEITLFSGSGRDPSSTSAPVIAVSSDSTIINWSGIAHYIPANSPITSTPFVTNFSVGQGTLFNVDGTNKFTGPWTNLSTQDVLPTWKWIVTSTGTKLSPAFDFTDAYYGPSSLKFTGTLTANASNEVKLFQMSLPVTSSTNLRMICKPGSATLQVGLAFEDNPSTFYYPTSTSSTSGSWTVLDFPLSSYAGKKIAMLTLKFSSTSTITSYSGSVGRIAIYNGSITTPAAPSNAAVNQIIPVDFASVGARVSWTASTSTVSSYNVYLRNPDNTETWLGSTPNTYYYVSYATKQNTETSSGIEIEAVAPDSGRSTSRATTTLKWPTIPLKTTKLTGTLIGLESDSGHPISNAFDGSTLSGNFYEYSGNDSIGWVGLDLGKPYVITAVRYFPRTNWSQRMDGGKIQGANTADFSDAVTLYQISGWPPEGVFSAQFINNSNTYRYVRYYTAGGGYGNITELEFYGAYSSSLAQVHATLGAGSQVKLSWTAGDNEAAMWPGATVDDTSSAITYSSNWTANTGVSGEYNNTDHTSSVTGATATFTFSGVGVKIYGTKNSSGGLASISIDGGVWATVDTYNSSTSTKQVLYQSPSLANGTHTVTVTVLGTRNVSSSGVAIKLDQVEYSSLFSGSSYNVKRSTTSGGPYSTIASVTAANTYTDTAVTAGTTYYYVITAVNNGTESNTTSEISVTPVSLPSPWNASDFGVTTPSGSTTYSGSTFTVKGAGADIGSAVDSFQYVYQTLVGDGMLTARVASLTNGTAGGKAGVMIRQDLTDTSPFVATMVTTSGAITQYRATTGAIGISTASSTTTTVPYYVRVARGGNTLTSSISVDGTNWTQVATSSVTITMSSTVSIGLAVTGQGASLATAAFDNVSLFVTASPTGLTAVRKDANSVTLTWNAATGTTTIKRATVSGGPYTAVRSNLASIITTWTDPNAPTGTPYYYIVTAKSNGMESPNSTEVVVGLDSYLQWVQQQGWTANTAFDQDANGNGIPNGVEYGAPKGLILSAGNNSDLSISIEIRNDPTVTATLLTSTDLITWTPVTLTQASDQTGVTNGFIKYTTQESMGSGQKKFYKLQLTK